MTTHRRFHPFPCVLFTLVVGILGCGGGGGGGGESFLVSGLWSVSGTPGAGTPNPSDSSQGGRACSAAAAGVGALPSTQINVVQMGSAVQGSEVGSNLAFTGAVNDPAQSFALNSTTPICSQQGSCQVCGAVAVNFLNAAGNNADVDISIAASGNAACPVQCAITFPRTTAARS